MEEIAMWRNIQDQHQDCVDENPAIFPHVDPMCLGDMSWCTELCES